MAPEMKKPALAGIGGCLDKSWMLAISAALTPFAGYVLWVKIARPCARKLLSYVPEGAFKEMLTKDRGGIY